MGLSVCLTLVAGRVTQTWTARLSLGLLLVLIVGDQARLQPWLYQAILELLILGFAPAQVQKRLCCLVMASIYGYSGISKLDHSFVHELGPLFLNKSLSFVSLSSENWPSSMRLVSILAMPVAEIAIAVLLLFPGTARRGTIGACILHLGLLLLVGPFGLRHSATVVGWNLALLIEVPLLFWPQPESDSRRFWQEIRAYAMCWVLLILLLLPLGERWGLWDSWPSFAVYASHNERIELFVAASEAEFWPEEIRPYLVPTNQADMLRLDLTNWSRFTRGVPPYPQARTGLGAALGLSDRIGAARPFYARVLSRAQFWTGDRRVICEGGPNQLRQSSHQFFWNALPEQQSLRWSERGVQPR